MSRTPLTLNSTAEDFYTHDYPEEESQSEDSEMGGSGMSFFMIDLSSKWLNLTQDMFHEDSEDDDFISDNLRWRD